MCGLCTLSVTDAAFCGLKNTSRLGCRPQYVAFSQVIISCICEVGSFLWLGREIYIQMSDGSNFLGE